MAWGFISYLSTGQLFRSRQGLKAVNRTEEKKFMPSSWPMNLNMLVSSFAADFPSGATIEIRHWKK